MKAMMNKNQLTVLVLIVVGVVVAQFPAFENSFLIPMTAEHPHLVTISEGIIAALLAWWASRKPAEAKP